MRGRRFQKSPERIEREERARAEEEREHAQKARYVRAEGPLLDTSPREGVSFWTLLNTRGESVASFNRTRDGIACTHVYRLDGALYMQEVKSFLGGWVFSVCVDLKEGNGAE